MLTIREAPQQTRRRLAWLDALRGIAALVVVSEHALEPLFPEAQLPVKAAFEPGWYGVMVFFLVSGYIVPASLERRGSVRAFGSLVSSGCIHCSGYAWRAWRCW